MSGIEVDSSATFFDSLRFHLGYSCLDTKLKSFSPPTIPSELSPIFAGFSLTQVVGEALALSPKHRLTLSGTYTLPLDDKYGEISLGATYVHTASQYFTRSDDVFVPNLNGSAAVQFRTANFDLWGANLGKLPATNILNLNFNWNSVLGQPIDVAAFITNVTNEVYPVAVGSSLASSGFESALFGPPRMWGLRVKYRFGD